MTVESIPLLPLSRQPARDQRLVPVKFIMKFRYARPFRPPYCTLAEMVLYSSSLKFNAVSEWWDEYIACVCCVEHISLATDSFTSYEALKKCIYQLEKKQINHDHLSTRDIESNEYSSLLSQQDVTNTDSLFIPLLDQELRKVVSFYENQEAELFNELRDLEDAVAHQEEVGLEAGERYLDHDTEEEDDDSIGSPTIPDIPLGQSRFRKSVSASRTRRRGAFDFPIICHVPD